MSNIENNIAINMKYEIGITKSDELGVGINAKTYGVLKAKEKQIILDLIEKKQLEPNSINITFLRY